MDNSNGSVNYAGGTAQNNNFYGPNNNSNPANIGVNSAYNPNDMYALINIQMQSLECLESIKSWVTFFGAMSILGFIGGIIALIVTFAR